MLWRPFNRRAENLGVCTTAYRKLPISFSLMQMVLVVPSWSRQLAIVLLYSFFVSSYSIDTSSLIFYPYPFLCYIQWRNLKPFLCHVPQPMQESREGSQMLYDTDSPERNPRYMLASHASLSAPVQMLGNNSELLVPYSTIRVNMIERR
jgi:hypothetical protein